MQTTISHLSSHCQQACCPSRGTSKAEFVWTPVGWGSTPIPSAFWPVCKNHAAAEIGVENSNQIVDLHWADDFYQYPVAKKNISNTDTTRSSTSASLASWVAFFFLHCYYWYKPKLRDHHCCWLKQKLPCLVPKLGLLFVLQTFPCTDVCVSMCFSTSQQFA